MPIGIQDRRHLTELHRDEIEHVLGNTPDLYFDMQRPCTRPFREYPARHNVEIIEARKHPGEDARVWLCGNPQMKNL